MKHFVLLLSSLFCSALLAQSLQITYSDSLVQSNANKTDELVGYVHIKNVSNVAVNVFAKRIDQGYTALTDSNAICWAGGCYIPSVSQSPFGLTINPGQTVTDFSGHVYPEGDGQASGGPITYVFWVENAPSDSVATTIYYQVTPNFSLTEVSTPKVAVFPNPTKDRISVRIENASADAQFEIYDMVGKRVFQKVGGFQSNFQVDLSKLPKGIYFYTLKEKGKKLMTKKLMLQ